MYIIEGSRDRAMSSESNVNSSRDLLRADSAMPAKKHKKKPSSIPVASPKKQQQPASASASIVEHDNFKLSPDAVPFQLSAAVNGSSSSPSPLSSAVSQSNHSAPRES